MVGEKVFEDKKLESGIEDNKSALLKIVSIDVFSVSKLDLFIFFELSENPQLKHMTKIKCLVKYLMFMLLFYFKKPYNIFYSTDFDIRPSPKIVLPKNIKIIFRI